ncbi:MAG: carboxymuconolactone decarboxylase family protein [Kofleriaceae bacterium]
MRIKSPALSIAGAMEPLMRLVEVTERGLDPKLAELVSARVGQINGCSVCVDMHTRALKKRGETEQRLFTLAAWRETPYFTPAERAALALAEAETKMDVTDAVWADAANHFDEPQLASLVMLTALANLWNRLNCTSRAVSGDWVEQLIKTKT